MENFRSTFPLNESAITRQALGRIFTDPITWVPLVPAVAAYTIFDLPSVLSMILGALALGGVTAFWRKQWAGITEGLRRTAIENHNRAQNSILKAGADELRLAGSGKYAARLEEFLAIKAKVEQRLHEDGEITAQKIQLEQLIDSLCFGVRDQLTALSQREKKGEPVDRKAALAQVDAAFETLEATVAELNTILGPSLPADGSTNASLEEITRRLREEAEIARRVQARLRAQETPLSPPTEPAKEIE